MIIVAGSNKTQSRFSPSGLVVADMIPDSSEVYNSPHAVPQQIKRSPTGSV